MKEKLAYFLSNPIIYISLFLHELVNKVEIELYFYDFKLNCGMDKEF
jgi:hypothetical protein